MSIECFTLCPPKHDPAKQHCFLTHCRLNSEASCINVSEETPSNWQPCQHACAQSATGVSRPRWDKDIPGRPNPPLTWTTLGQLCVTSWVSPVMASCYTAWDRTRTALDRCATWKDPAPNISNSFEKFSVCSSIKCTFLGWFPK